MTTTLLPLAVRIATVTQKRDTALLVAFDADMEIESVNAQTIGVSEADRQSTTKELANKAANCRASAARLTEILATLEAEQPS